MKDWQKRLREIVVIGLVLANVCVWWAVFSSRPSDKLRVYFLDVGQGDAIFIDSPTHGRVLVDGGPNRKVLSELGKIIPFGDRRIDVVLETHPDADHITGLVDIFDRYEVGVFLEPGVESPNPVDNLLKQKVKEEKAESLIARRGMEVDLGGGVKLMILFPNTDVSTWETNEASVVAKLIYKNKSFLLTGDSPKVVEYKLINLNEKVLDADVLKAGHHGSDTSTSLLFATKISPEYAVISAGKDNRYGHPKQSVLDTLKKVGAKAVSTIDLGTIEFETDGETLDIK